MPYCQKCGAELKGDEAFCAVCGALVTGAARGTEARARTTDGVYQHVRHPLYLGEITRNLGFALTLSSIYGVLLMLAGNVFLVLRLELEEKMLTDAFGQEYTEYQKRTSKLIPFLY